MINLCDEKGKSLGMDYDYEYRGAARERNRDAPLKRAGIICAVWTIVFLSLVAAVLVKMAGGSLEGDVGMVISCTLFVLALAAIFPCLHIRQRKRHLRLLEAIEKQTGRRPL